MRKLRNLRKSQNKIQKHFTYYLLPITYYEI